MALVLSLLLLLTCVTLNYSHYRGPTSKTPPAVQKPSFSVREPTCDELRSMWRFARQQVRTAEMTNAIPLYKDALAYNKWESSEEKLPKSPKHPLYYGKIHYTPDTLKNKNSFKDPCDDANADPQCFATIKFETQNDPFQINGGKDEYKPGSVAGSFDYLKNRKDNRKVKEPLILNPVAMSGKYTTDGTRPTDGSVAGSLDYLKKLIKDEKLGKNQTDFNTEKY